MSNYGIIYAANSGVVVNQSFSAMCVSNNCTVEPGAYLLIKLSDMSEGQQAENAQDIGADLAFTENASFGNKGLFAVGPMTDLAKDSQDCEAIKAASDDIIAMDNHTLCKDVVGGVATGIYNADGDGVTANRHTHAYFRKGAGCTDTDDNAADFEVSEASPRNRQTAANVCPAE